jgi:glycerate kinase
VLIAPTSFKGSLTPSEAARSMADGLARLRGVAVTLAPIADGGEGTLDVLIGARGGRTVTVPVRDPLGRRIEARLGLLPDGSAIVEAALASGLMHLAPVERDPLRATTHGVADLLKAALEAGARHITVAIGGSGTVDGGIGLLIGLGARVTDRRGRPIGRPGDLEKVASVDLAGLDERLVDVELVALCDVQSPLLGPRGAHQFMAQKGADAETADRLERGLAHLYEVIEHASGIDVSEEPGSGAAGGLGAALALLGASMEPGAERVLQAIGLEAQVRRADVVLTGEGRIDAQTAEGKAIAHLARLCRKHRKPCIAISGARDRDLAALHEAGVTAVVSALPAPSTVEEAMAGAAASLADAAEQVGRILLSR